MSKILVFGKNGQLGQSFYRLLRDKKMNATFIDYPDVDFLKPKETLDILQKENPTLVINSVAYTQVDKAETEKEQAFQVNAYTPQRIAEWCHKKEIPLIHYSTDYVFDGLSPHPYSEEDATKPLNIYGASKLEGERLILGAHHKAYILRTSWVFAPWGNSFIKTMAHLCTVKESLKIVDDQISAPTYAPHGFVNNLRL